MRRAAGLVLLVLAWRCVACVEDRPACYAGEYAGCTCANGERGYAACDPQRDVWGACVCDGTTPGLDASTAEPPEASIADVAPETSLADAASDAATDAAKLALFASCETSAECESGICFAFGSGSRCTVACTDASTCPAPSPGCNPTGVCRAP